MFGNGKSSSRQKEEAFAFQEKERGRKGGGSRGCGERRYGNREKIYVAVDEEFSGESVCISPDMNKVKVYSLEQDIRLV